MSDLNSTSSRCTNIDKSVLKDVLGRYRTISLFYDLKRADRTDMVKYPPIWTVREDDRVVSHTSPTGETIVSTFKSLKKIYLSYDHLPGVEYEFAIDTFGSWEHWLLLSEHSLLKPYVDDWRHELEVKNRANALKTILAQSREVGNIAAAKLVVSGDYKGPQKRQSAQEKLRQQRIDKEAKDLVEQDAERIGLTLVK